MNDRPDPYDPHPPDSYEPCEPLDELVDQLLNCGGVLSQMISHMVAFESSGRSHPDTAPIPDVAHSLIRSVLDGVPKRYSKRDIRVAATIVAEVTEAICHDIFLVSPEMLADEPQRNGQPPDNW